MESREDVIEYRAAIEHACFLKCAHDTTLSDLVRPKAVQGRPAVTDRAFGRFKETGDHIERCRLTGAIRSDQANDFLLVDNKIKA